VDELTMQPAGEADSLGTAVLGAGPAGLTAAYVLAIRGRPATVFEAGSSVGGIAKTVVYNGYRFDLGGHRFFTKLAPVQQLWENLLGAEFLVRPRLSRIYYKSHFFAYPLQARDVLARLGVIESIRCTLSYAASKVNRWRLSEETFQDWVTSRFGKRLYSAFFASYTEKVWGIPGSEIRAEWAAQRIKDFSFTKAALNILGIRRHVTTSIERFHYPRLGPGQMWELLADRVEERGIPVQLNRRCTTVCHRSRTVESIVVWQDGVETTHHVDAVLSSVPLSELVLSLDPPPPPEIESAARRLRYRDLCLVALVLDTEQPFPDNWIYLHDEGTRAGRVQNFGAWSESMVKPGTTCLGVEYFCFEGDEIWEMPTDEAVALATRELANIGLIDPDSVIDGVKVLVPRAYPMYDGDYADAVSLLREYLGTFTNMRTFGRNGLHRYNNQDHSMWTAILATLNQLDGTTYDVWSVNTEAEYHEESDVINSILAVELVA
jgi:protoporphyrinogen oxidase